MKFTCTQDNLSQGLNIVSRLSEKSTNLPILNNVLIEARKEGIILTTTNLELGIKTKIRGKIEKEGIFTIPAKLVTDFVNSLKKENVTAEIQDGTLYLQGENHQTSIRGLDAADFPTLPDIDDAYSFSAKIEDFKEMLTQIVFAISTDESRQELNGAYFQINGSICTVAATDSFRLSEKKITVKNKSKESKNSIVPGRTLYEVLRILDLEDADTINIQINDNQIQFVFGSTEIISRIVTGEYPDYSQIIPSEFSNIVELTISDMTKAIKTTSLFCKQGINDVRISLDKRFDDITIRAENSVHGKNVSHVKSISKDQEMDIVFNYKFLLDGLLHMPDETVLLKTNNATSPALLTTKKDTGFIYIIMPIRQ